MIIICYSYIDSIFKTANFKFLNLNYIICYSHPRVTFSPPASKVQKNLCSYACLASSVHAISRSGAPILSQVWRKGVATRAIRHATMLTAAELYRVG